ncbi:hypothetical protein HW115_09545 [Verrucomicrobiaceae bacterium N1E253]|uniref:PDZ domain-containing protein n=1 Tax=Oceaniferula marina TaxID=2748318 RepID=A0A851GNY8_9BACT|nr:DUF6288 domain-containing protein [Oceaniferula marina]NWK55854.1 hypothetical protein [Oceaniferula marina]
MMKPLIPSLLLTCLMPWPLTAEDAEARFNFNAWKQDRGAVMAINEWHKENPSPYRSYFPSTKTESMEKWYINLGPLGIRNRMHDRTWSLFPACKELFPKALSDEHGLVFNNFEVDGVRKNSPAEGQLQKGDLIVELDGQRLLAAQHMFLDRAVDNKLVRGIEIHAGNLIDKAEGRGEIKVTVLRLPDELKSKSITGLRSWKQVGKSNIDSAGKLSVPLGQADVFRIQASNKKAGVKLEEVYLVNAEGVKMPVRISYKRGSLLGALLEVPEGSWTLVGDVTCKKATELKVETLPVVDYPAALKKHLKTVTLKLDAIGSFGDGYDPECDKVKNYAAMVAHRLATQQNKDGSWSAKSYASQSFYTSAIGLALLSTDNPLYDANIKLAAHYVANAGERDKWTYSNGMWLVFLAEYYLKTKDETILPALKMHVANCRRFVMSDYTSGHSDGGPGYGGSGYIGGGGVLALGFALASHTPVMSEDDQAVLDKMLSRVQEIAPHGKVPYGRSGKSTQTTPMPGQGGSCGTGPYFLASLIRGGAPLFTENATKRYSTAPFGSAENGHATQTLHFVWACLSTANCGAEAHRQNMSDYLWKFTTLRDHDGFVNQNGYRVEYHNGDGVIGGPYWRMAGYLMIFNAHKRNLAITGNPKFRTAARELPVVFHRDRAMYNEVMRSWALAEAYLGDKVPSEFTTAVTALRAIKPGENLGTDLRALLKQHAPVVAKSILASKDLPKGLAPAQLVELVMGVSFEASCHPDIMADYDDGLGARADKAAQKEAKAKMKKEQKKREKQLAAGKIDKVSHRLVIRPVSRLQADSEKAGGMDVGTALFTVKDLIIEVADPSKDYLKKPLREKVNLAALEGFKRGKPVMGEKVPGQLHVFDMKSGAQGRLLVKVTYSLAGIPISYTAPMDIPAPEARGYVPILCRVPVKGTVSEDYDGRSYCALIQLETGQLVGCEHRNHPAKYLLAGSSYDFEISPGSTWAHDLRAAKSLTPDHRLARVTSVEGVKDGQKLHDHRYDGGIELEEGTRIITIDLEKAEAIQRVFIQLAALQKGKGAPRVPHTFEAMVDGKWTLLRKGFISGMMPVIANNTKQVRLTLEVPKGGVLLQEVNLITQSPLVRKPAMSW